MKKIFIIATLAIFSAANGYAAEGRWTEGGGQGNLEYFIDYQGTRLYIGCPTKEGSEDAASSVTLERISDGMKYKQFTVSVNGISYDGPFDADSRVGTQNFLSLLAGLRKADAVVKAGSKTMTFPKSNAAKVVPVYGKGFSCNLM
ncbi:MAG: hypothetical protein WA071_14880 [Undibacterium umbellatum]|uniref:hypothetical protein n=1 Tax=Undibacterium umbellatum TaxID=2762300 RepID=UPI003BB72C18